MNVKIVCHFMPWEIDYVHKTFEKIRMSIPYIDGSHTISVASCLNVSDFIINWEKSSLPKSLFVDKYRVSSNILDGFHTSRVQDGNVLYGHLDMERESVSSEVDYYINICPDMYFHEHLLNYLISSAEQIKNKYFMITPQIYKMWDYTWDHLVYKDYMDIPYNKWDGGDVYDIEQTINSITEPPFLTKINNHKWAGWLDLYSKSYYEDLVPSQPDWVGYGPRDTFGMVATQIAKNNGVDFQQYLLNNQIIFEYPTGKFKTDNLSSIYKNRIVLNPIDNQRKIFEEKFDFYLKRWFNTCKSKRFF